MEYPGRQIKLKERVKNEEKRTSEERGLASPSRSAVYDEDNVSDAN